MEQLNKWMTDGGRQVLTVGWEVTDNQGKEVRMIHLEIELEISV